MFVIKFSRLLMLCTYIGLKHFGLKLTFLLNFALLTPVQIVLFQSKKFWTGPKWIRIKWRTRHWIIFILCYTGIQSQCTVRINSTHVFMAGGYAEAYKVTDALIRTDSESDADLDIANLGSNKGCHHFWKKYAVAFWIIT